MVVGLLKKKMKSDSVGPFNKNDEYLPNLKSFCDCLHESRLPELDTGDLVVHDFYRWKRHKTFTTSHGSKLGVYLQYYETLNV